MAAGTNSCVWHGKLEQLGDGRPNCTATSESRRQRLSSGNAPQTGMRRIAILSALVLGELI